PPLAGTQPPPNRNAIAPTQPVLAGIRSSGPGYLRRSGIQVDGQTTYALENRRGELLLYVTPEPGVNAEPHLNRLVELFGAIKEGGDVRGASHMYATRVVELK